MRDVWMLLSRFDVLLSRFDLRPGESAGEGRGGGEGSDPGGRQGVRRTALPPSSLLACVYVGLCLLLLVLVLVLVLLHVLRNGG